MNNPPAFPQQWPHESGTHHGMTLRDYFAAAAMNGLYSDTYFTHHKPNETARLAYEQADAMLKAREQ